ncbi:MAG: hypothetical protein ACF8R7_11110 [Phycisphaerales bacterium JB039]
MRGVIGDSEQGSRVGSDLAFVIGACVVVGLAALLGASWLKATLLGLPAGMWIVGAAWGVRFWLRERDDAGKLGSWRDAVRPVMDPATASLVLVDEDDEPAGRPIDGFPAVRIASKATQDAMRLGLEASALSARWLDDRLLVLGGRAAELERLVASWSDRSEAPVRPLRIGLDLPPDLLHEIVRAPSGAEIDWRRTTLGADPGATLRRLGLDAGLAHDGSDYPLLIVANEAPGLEAAWHDWGVVNPLSYPSALPRRIDPCQTTVRRFDWRREEDVATLRALLDAAAALSRHPCRLTLADRFRGRRPSPALTGGSSALAGAMLRIGQLLGASGRAMPGDVQRIAARALGAWLSTAADVGRQRCELATTVQRLLDDEAATLLRCAAAHFAEFDDDAGMDTLRQAARLLEGVEILGDADCFLHAEIVGGAGDPITVGRIAAGIWLTCLTAKAERLEFLLDDIFDDLRDAAWLSRRGQDHMMLRQITRDALALRGRTTFAAAA